MNTGLLVTGTDTGVGKTFVAAGLARLWNDAGIDVGGMKPAESGHDPLADGVWPADARCLIEAARVADPLDEVAPYVFVPPVAPLVAARDARRPIEPERLRDRFERISARHSFVVVEGAGGLGVPLAEFGENDRLFDYADLARLFDIPLLVVARAHLGTLNHCFLTVDYARRRGVEVVGVVLNGLDRSLLDASVPGNAAMVEEMNEVPVLGVVERINSTNPTVDEMADACRASIDIDRLQRRMSELGVKLFADASQATSPEETR